jgi:fatty-acyl-CoA synthase
MSTTQGPAGPEPPRDVAAEAGHPSARWPTVFALVDHYAAATPEAPAASFPSGEIGYGELRERSLTAARALLAAGVRRGDRVGILLRAAGVPYVELALGILRVGAVVVPINARNKARELEHVVRHAGLSLLVSAEEFGPIVADADVVATCPVVVVEDAAAFWAASDAVAPEEVTARERSVRRTDHAQIIYTSGTTGLPKGALHTHATLLAEGENCATRLQVRQDDRFWTALPLFHCGGWQTMLAAWSRGACFSHVGLFDGDTAFRQLVDERCTHAFPAFELIWADVLGHPEFAPEKLSALRVVWNVGPPEHMLQMQRRLPHAKQVSSMGSTESCGAICVGSPDDPLESRMATSGAPLPGAELRVVDPETRRDVAVGETGELLFRGVTLFAGYYADPAATAASQEDGWFLSGDLVRLEDHGGVSFVSRLKDMLKVGGENVAAVEIEGYLINHPAIEQVAVVGAPDRRYGEVAVAYVRLHPGHALTQAELVDFCVDRIATYKIPRYVRVVEEFPVTASQKVQKVELRRMIADELRAAGIDEAPRLERRTTPQSPKQSVEMGELR